MVLSVCLHSELMSQQAPSSERLVYKVSSLVDGLLFEFKYGQADEKTHITYRSHRVRREELLYRTL